MSKKEKKAIKKKAADIARIDDLADIGDIGDVDMLNNLTKPNAKSITASTTRDTDPGEALQKAVQAFVQSTRNGNKKRANVGTDDFIGLFIVLINFFH
jgi:hypothetical protein